MSQQSLGAGYRLLEFLKQQTDQDHPATQSQLREAAGEELSKQIMGDKGTFSRRLGELMDAYNRDQEGTVLPRQEWRIVSQGFNKTNPNGKNGKIHYSHEVSGNEMDFLIRQIRRTNYYTDAEKESLERRLRKALCSKHYEYSDRALIRELPTGPAECVGETGAKADLEEKIRIVREHILHRKMLELTVVREVPVDPEEDMQEEVEVQTVTEKLSIRVSPYRLVAQNGFCWLVGNWHERPQKNVPWNYYTDVLTAIRIDKIEEAETAHTPYETTINWTSNMYMRMKSSYTRFSMEQRKTKARYPQAIRNRLDAFDRAEGMELQHMMDIE